MAQFYRAMDEPDEVPHCHPSHPVNPGFALCESEVETELTELRYVLEDHHAQVMARLSLQDEALDRLSAKRFLPRVRNAEDLLEVRPVESLKSHQSSTSRASRASRASRKSSSQPTFTPTFFSTYSKADLQQKTGAHHRHSVRQRKVFASFRTSDPSGDHSGKSSPSWCQRIVWNSYFDVFFAIVVITNAIFIGVDVQYSMSYSENLLAFYVGHYIYTVLFIAELVLRLLAEGLKFYCGEDWMWAWLDTFIVISSLWDIVVDIMYVWDGASERLSELSSWKAFRIIRITRIVKAVRLVRIFRFVMALRMLVTSIMHTLKSLFWAMVLLGLIIYTFAVLLSQVVHDHITDPGASELPEPELASALLYYGSVTNTMLSLFMSIAGGCSWDLVIAPLQHISLVWTLVFLFFISFTYFAVLNVVTGVFCQSAIESAQNDHLAVVQSILENKEAHLTKIKALFSKFGVDDEGDEETAHITFPMFEEKIGTPEVRDYFESLRLDVSDAWTFFKMLDLDGGGAIALDEFLMGCLRLRGQARAIDVGKILHEQSWLIRNQGKFQTHVEVELKTMKAQLEKLLFGFDPTPSSPSSARTVSSKGGREAN
ncbi:unnamed protein product [Effrenium voratum]|nr:unnamed protein product [Effrenium voratum]